MAVADPFKRLQDPLEIPAINAHSRVNNGKFRHLIAVVDVEVHPAFFGVFDGVGQ